MLAGGKDKVTVESETQDGERVQQMVLPGSVGEGCSVRSDISTGKDGFLNVKAGASLSGKIEDLYDLGDQCRRFCVEHWRLFYRDAAKAVMEERK